MKRLAAALLALSVVVFTTTGALAAGPPANAVTWSVDQDAKVITATVRLTLYPKCSPSMLAARNRVPKLKKDCTVTDEMAQKIADNIKNTWNNGHRYKCYDVVIDVQVTVVNDVTAPFAPDSAFIGIDQTSGNVRSFVSGGGFNPGSAWNSNSYGDRFVPTNDGANPSVWGYPPASGLDANLYAHEAGHVLGLEDGYEDVKDPNGNTISRPRPDAPDDVMTHQKNSSVAQSTIDRLVERSDTFQHGEKVKCDYKIDTTIDWYHFQSLKCGGPEGQWDILVSGVRDLGGGRLVLTGNGKVTLVKDHKTITGPWNADFFINLEGVPVSIGQQSGTITGDGSLAASVLRLKGTHAEGSFFVSTPARSLSGASGNPLKDFQLPVLNDQFC